MWHPGDSAIHGQETIGGTEEFVELVCHDLRAPLRSVASYSSILRSELDACGQCGEASRRYLGIISDQARRGQDMLSALAAFARIPLEGDPSQIVDAGDVVAEVVEGLGPEIDDAAADVEVDKLPTVRCDRRQLGTLLRAVVENALKFRGTPCRVTLSAVPADAGWWELRIRDNGPGIPSHAPGRPFQLFQRLHTAKEYPGLGVGLALAKQVVDRHRGRMSIATADDGPGTTVRFTLPAP